MGASVLRVKQVTSIAVGLLAGMAAFANPAQAVSVAVDLSISYFPASVPSPPNIFPSGTQLTGFASFYTDGQIPLPPNIFIGHLGVGDVFSTSFEPPDPCLATVSCQLSFSFGGQVDIPGNPVAPPPFFASAFPLGIDVTKAVPGPPQIMPLDYFQGGAALMFSGPIVAFDSPVIVGEWDITIREATATPLPAALPLFATGLGAFGLLGWRRKRKGAAITT